MTESEQFRKLTLMERQCLRLWDGKGSGPRIAQQLKISTKTVENHTAGARRALGVSSTDEAAALFRAYETGSTQNAPRELLGVASDAAVPPITPQPSSVPHWQLSLPLRQKGALSNDLTVRQRLFWIGAIPIALAASFGLLVIALRIISDVARAALR